MLTYRKLLEALDEAQTRKAWVELCAKELYRCAASDYAAQDAAEAKFREAEARLDEELD